MITIHQKGDWNKTEKFLSSRKNYLPIFAKYGAQGVSALSSVTPKDTGETANSWSFKVEITRSGFTISWLNSSAAGTAPVAILLQYGHGTKNGGYVQGQDYINPVMRPIFDQIAENLWKEVASL
jgi:hypothetical protein